MRTPLRLLAPASLGLLAVLAAAPARAAEPEEPTKLVHRERPGQAPVEAKREPDLAQRDRDGRSDDRFDRGGRYDRDGRSDGRSDERYDRDGRYDRRDDHRPAPHVHQPAWVPGHWEVHHEQFVVPAVTQRRWVPAYTERFWVEPAYEEVRVPAVVERVWVPEVRERVWVEPRYDFRLDLRGQRIRVRLGDGHYEDRVVSPAHYEDRVVRHGRVERRVVRAGYYEDRVVRPGRYETVVVAPERVEHRHHRVWVPGRYEHRG